MFTQEFALASYSVVARLTKYIHLLPLFVFSISLSEDTPCLCKKLMGWSDARVTTIHGIAYLCMCSTYTRAVLKSSWTSGSAPLLCCTVASLRTFQTALVVDLPSF
jgi:hypothetical protein